MARSTESEQVHSLKLGWGGIAGIALFSVLYFADVCFKASHKCFWFDELFTVFLCRLPDFKSVWLAVAHGADFNPPLFYLLERGSRTLFGQGLVATRLPSMIGVWLFCICLVLFVARRAGVICGLIAGAFPFFTLIQYYAYEARAHGIVLGWYGLALFCWQQRRVQERRYLWLAAFGLSVTAALLTHVYAVYLLFPFVLVELYNLINRNRPDWSILAVLAMAFASVTVAVYLPLVRNYRASIPSNFYSASHFVLEQFFLNVVGPASAILILWLLLAAWNRPSPGSSAEVLPLFPREEVVLAIGFACIPIIGLLGCKATHGPFFARYFLASVAGCSIFLAITSANIQSFWFKAAFAGSLFFLMLADLGTTIYLARGHRILLLEPSTGLQLGTDPSDPMLLYQTLSTDKRGLDIMILPNLEYIYLFEYAPQSIKSHLYYGAPLGDVNLGGYERLAKWGGIHFQLTAFRPFLATHQEFLLYQGQQAADLQAMQAIADAGYSLISVKADAAGILSEYAR